MAYAVPHGCGSSSPGQNAKPPTAVCIERMRSIPAVAIFSMEPGAASSASRAPTSCGKKSSGRVVEVVCSMHP